MSSSAVGSGSSGRPLPPASAGPVRKLAVDASVAIKRYVPELGSAEAVAILQGGHVLFAPDLLVAELGNVLWKKVGQGELSAAEAGEIADGFTSACPVTLWPSSPLLRPALDIATTFKRTVYDSLYLAVTLAEGARLVTADERLDNALRGTKLAPTIQRLGTT